MASSPYIYVLLVLCLQLIVLCKVQKYPSPLVKICRDGSETICIGVFIRNQWILSSNLCEHVIYKETKVLVGNLQRDCTTGETKKILGRHEFTEEQNIVLWHIEGASNTSIVNLKKNISRGSICDTYCLQGTHQTCGKKIKPIPTQIASCKDYNSSENKVCLKIIDNKSMKNINGSPILCNGSMVGYVSWLSSKMPTTVIDVSRFYKRINEIITDNAKLKSSQHNVSPSLVKICQDDTNIPNVCFGVYVGPQWVLANNLCSHIYAENVTLMMGSIRRNCKTGQLNKVEKIVEVNTYEKAVLIKVISPFKLHSRVTIIDVEDQYDNLANCFAYCQENIKNEVCDKDIEPISVSLLSCSDIFNSTESPVKDKICIRKAEDKSPVPFIEGSPIICNKKLIGYALAINALRRYEEAVILVSNFNDHLSEVIGSVPHTRMLYKRRRGNRQMHRNRDKKYGKGGRRNKYGKRNNGKKDRHVTKSDSGDKGSDKNSLGHDLKNMKRALENLAEMKLKNINRDEVKKIRRQVYKVKEISKKAEEKLNRLTGRGGKPKKNIKISGGEVVK